jgi:hypothetical protein
LNRLPSNSICADSDAPGHPLTLAPPPQRNPAGRLDVARRETLALVLPGHRRSVELSEKDGQLKIYEPDRLVKRGLVSRRFSTILL